MTYGSPAPVPIIPPAQGASSAVQRNGQTEDIEETIRPNARLSEVARCYGISARVLFCWKQELTSAAAPMFVAVEITDPALSDRGYSIILSSSSHGIPGFILAKKPGQNDCLLTPADPEFYDDAKRAPAKSRRGCPGCETRCGITRYSPGKNGLEIGVAQEPVVART
jgi:hypothetical protein